MTAPRVEAVGEIDVTTAPDLRGPLYDAIDTHPGQVVVVDLSAVEFMDSTGLGMLVGALKYSRTSGGDIALVGARPNVWKVFTITGLDKVFTAQEPS